SLFLTDQSISEGNDSENKRANPPSHRVRNKLRNPRNYELRKTVEPTRDATNQETDLSIGIAESAERDTWLVHSSYSDSSLLVASTPLSVLFIDNFKRKIKKERRQRQTERGAGWRKLSRNDWKRWAINIRANYEGSAREAVPTWSSSSSGE
ncbi:hypothetical protein K0M31_018489, partial [Melipona bicolor]